MNAAPAPCVAVVNASVTDDELRRLDAARVRGVRFNLATRGGATTIEMLEPVAKRIAPMGWGVQFNMSAEMTLAAKDVLSRPLCQIVFDHLAHTRSPPPPAIRPLRWWPTSCKRARPGSSSRAPIRTPRSAPPTYADTIPLAQAYVKAAPERVVWGSDWSHPSEQSKPALADDAVLFDLLAQWAPDEAVRGRILVDDPATLCGFS